MIRILRFVNSDEDLEPWYCGVHCYGCRCRTIGDPLAFAIVVRRQKCGVRVRSLKTRFVCDILAFVFVSDPIKLIVHVFNNINASKFQRDRVISPRSIF